MSKGKRDQHVAPAPGGWVVRKAGSSRATRAYSTQKEAIAAAREIARHQRTDVYIHGDDGRIRQRDSFGSDVPAAS